MKSSFVSIALAGLFVGLQAQAQTELTLKLDQPGASVNPKLYGLMTEEINYSYDGGLYAELIRNRVFKDNPRSADHWSLVKEGEAAGSMGLDNRTPLNTHLPVSLKLQADRTGKRLGVANEGYWGIPVRPKTTYSVSFYAKGSSNTLTASLESTDGKVIYASAQTAAISGDWKQYRLSLTTGDVKATAEARFVLSVNGPGTYWFDLVSVFPPTYNNTPNGNRPDIMKLLADMKPAFLRVPGGNYLEGNTISQRFNWKKTLGSLEQRPGHQGTWSYRSSDGMGLYEFLKWCEDLKMEPLLAVYAGYSLNRDYFDEPEFLQPFINEALDEIEYVIGDKSTKWGAVRARDGHPEPFKLTYVEIGNEDGFDNSGSYEIRFNLFANAIRSKYPQLKLISTVGGQKDWLSGRFPVPKATPELVDEHYYRNAMEMFEIAGQYDSYDRNGPKIFVGEWATREGFPTTNFNSALGDAAWMTGMERNADLVQMSCYAPLFVNVNPGGMQWKSDLIGYNALTSYGSPSYHVQKMFSNNLGDKVVPLEASNVPTQFKKLNAVDSAAGAKPKAIPAMFYAATRDSKTGTVFLKIVNATGTAQPVRLNISGVTSVRSEGTVITIKADKPEATNSITEPEKIVPFTSKLKHAGKNFVHSVPAYSVSVLRLQTK